MELIDQEREKYFLTRLNKKTNQIERVDMLTGETVQIGQALTQTNIVDPNYMQKYTLEVSDIICNMIREGKGMGEIVKENPFLPSVAVIYKWKGLFPDFERKLEAAYRDRALYHVDKATEIAELAPNLQKEEIAGYKLASDIHLKLAARNDPSRWSDSVKISGDKDAPLRILVDTGIRRATDEGFDKEEFAAIDAEFNKVKEIAEEVVDAGN